MGYDNLGVDAGVCLINILIAEKQPVPSIITALEAMLNSKYAAARRHARMALSMLDRSRRAELAFVGLQEEDFMARKDAVEDLYGAGEIAVAPLSELIKREQEPYIRDEGIKVLSSCNESRAIEIMQWLLDNGITTTDGKSIKRRIETLRKRRAIREYILTGKEL